VRYSAQDAPRRGFAVVVIDDACRPIDVDGSLAATRQAFAQQGIACVPAAALCRPDAAV
jgi:nicotinamidase/pyrazinamidase